MAKGKKAQLQTKVWKRRVKLLIVCIDEDKCKAVTWVQGWKVFLFLGNGCDTMMYRMARNPFEVRKNKRLHHKYVAFLQWVIDFSTIALQEEMWRVVLVTWLFLRTRYDGVTMDWMAVGSHSTTEWVGESICSREQDEYLPGSVCFVLEEGTMT